MNGAIISGIEAQIVQVYAKPPHAGLAISGLSEVAAREVRVRVRAALAAVDVEGLSLEIEDCGSARAAGLDLAIALRCVAARPHVLAIGELGLDGAVRGTRGVLCALHAAARSGDAESGNAAAKSGITTAIIPAAASREVTPWLHLPGLRDLAVYPVSTLREAIAHATGRLEPGPAAPERPAPCMSEVRGLYAAKRALEIAAVGGYSVLLTGAPGSGKTMLARRLPGILPAPSELERYEVARIYSASGLPSRSERPFRAPHHTASVVALTGGGQPARAGEVTLAHGGVLFLDELPEFPRATLEALGRGIFHSGVIHLRGSTRGLPARPVVVAARNSCPCGFAGSPVRRCVCTAERITRYLGRSAAIANRCAVHVIIPYAPVHERQGPAGETSEQIRARVTRARAILDGRDADELVQEKLALCIAALDGRRDVTDADRVEAWSYTPETHRVSLQAVAVEGDTL